MTLLQANNTLQANALLQKMAADVKTKTQPYSFAPVEGVTVAAKITGSLGTTAKGDGFTYTVNSNQADSLTFGSVEGRFADLRQRGMEGRRNLTDPSGQHHLCRRGGRYFENSF